MTGAVEYQWRFDMLHLITLIARYTATWRQQGRRPLPIGQKMLLAQVFLLPDPSVSAVCCVIWVTSSRLLFPDNQYSGEV